MNKNILFVLALICTLIGILIILFISENLEIKQIKIENITENMLGKEVRIIATIKNIKTTPGLYILTLKDETGEIKAIIFKEDKLEFKNKDKVEIIGKVIKYKNMLEIQVNQLNTL